MILQYFAQFGSSAKAPISVKTKNKNLAQFGSGSFLNFNVFRGAALRRIPGHLSCMSRRSVPQFAAEPNLKLNCARAEGPLKNKNTIKR